MSDQVGSNVGSPIVPLVLRGRVITDHLVDSNGRGGDLIFRSPDVRKYLDQMPLPDPASLIDLYHLSFDDILAYLSDLRQLLSVSHNRHLQIAREWACKTTTITPPIIDSVYANLGDYFDPDVIRENVEHQVGVKYLEGWIRQRMRNGQDVETRCFGARCLHIIAGNMPVISALTIVRNAVMRSDAIIKLPSNDPFTAPAIAQTMCEMAPDHPITKHLVVAYWRGGDETLEQQLYQPANVEKIIAWGGFASVKHVTRYIQPGMELISFDPKRSTSIVGKEALASEAMMREAAARIAADVGAFNQVACVNARVVYVQCGTTEEGLQKLERLGQYVYEAILALPSSLSTKAKRYDPELRACVSSLCDDDEWYRVIGGENDEGAVIVSRIAEAVSFAPKLADRTTNLVPIDDLGEAVAAANAYTQTVGVFPESVKAGLLDILSLHGAQRFVSLGFAVAQCQASPQDGIEPLRRMGRWVTNEISRPGLVETPWLSAELLQDNGQRVAEAGKLS